MQSADHLEFIRLKKELYFEDGFGRIYSMTGIQNYTPSVFGKTDLLGDNSEIKVEITRRKHKQASENSNNKRYKKSSGDAEEQKKIRNDRQRFNRRCIFQKFPFRSLRMKYLLLSNTWMIIILRWPIFYQFVIYPA